MPFFEVSASPRLGGESFSLMLDLANRKVLVLGLGDTGLSMARWLTRRGAQVRVADSRAEPPHAAWLARELPRVALATGTFSDETLRGADLSRSARDWTAARRPSRARSSAACRWRATSSFLRRP